MKYVIEINDHPMNDSCTPALYRAKGFRTLVFDEVGLNKLTPLSDAIGDIIKEEREEAYNIGYDKGYDKAHAECVAKNTRSYNNGYSEGLEDGFKDGKTEGEEELKGIVFDFLKSMVEKSESKFKPEVQIFDACDDCRYAHKEAYEMPCVDCKHSHRDFYEGEQAWMPERG